MTPTTTRLNRLEKRSARRGRPAAIRIFTVALGLVLAAAALRAQVGAPGSADPAADKPKVFIEGAVPDRAEIERQIPFAVWTDDPEAADVRLSFELAAPGLVLRFTGRGRFEGRDGALNVPIAAGEPPDKVQPRVVQTVKLGLLRYAGQTPLAGRIGLKLQDAVKPTSVVDPWNFWVFSASADAFLMGESSYKTSSLYGSLSARRVTPEWKMSFGLRTSTNLTTYIVEDYRYESESSSRGFDSLVVRSLGEHWSIGAMVKVSSSTYDNLRARFSARPAVEYDLFPYSESTKHQLRFIYAVGPSYTRYDKMTLYEKTRETLWSESLTACLELQKPWGTVTASLEGSHYFHDLKFYRLSLEGELSLRIIRGLNFNISGGGARIHDQLALPFGDATKEEVLLQIRELETSFNYFFSVGLSFTFGSKNTVVNPRFGSGSGTSISIHM